MADPKDQKPKTGGNEQSATPIKRPGPAQASAAAPRAKPHAAAVNPAAKQSASAKPAPNGAKPANGAQPARAAPPHKQPGANIAKPRPAANQGPAARQVDSDLAEPAPARPKPGSKQIPVGQPAGPRESKRPACVLAVVFCLCGFGTRLFHCILPMDACSGSICVGRGVFCTHGRKGISD